MPTRRTEASNGAAAAGLTVVTGVLVAGCGGPADDGAGGGQGAGTGMSVVVCVAEDAEVSPSAGIDVRQDGRTIGSLRDRERPTRIEVGAAGGSVEVLSDGEVLAEQTGGAGDRLVFALGDCTPPPPASR